MGKEESTQFIVKNIGFDDFKEYVEQDFIEKLSQQGILFLDDKYSSKALLKIKLPKKVTNQLDIANLGNKFKGGYVKEIGNNIQYNLFTYKKLGLIGNILTLITDQPYDEYRINTTMAVSRASLDRASLKVVISPTPVIIGKKGLKKVLIAISAVFLLSLAGLTIVFPPAIFIFILAAILAVLLLPFAIIESVRNKQIIKKGKEKLIDAIQEVIRSDYQTDM